MRYLQNSDASVSCVIVGKKKPKHYKKITNKQIKSSFLALGCDILNAAAREVECRIK